MNDIEKPRKLYREDIILLISMGVLTIWQIILSIPGFADNFKYLNKDMFLNIFFGIIIFLLVLFSLNSKYKKTSTLIVILIVSLLDIFVPLWLFVIHLVALINLIFYWKYVIKRLRIVFNEEDIEEDE